MAYGGTGDSGAILTMNTWIESLEALAPGFLVDNFQRL
jgi:hypothetical protein